MGLILINEAASKEDIDKARKDYEFYIKITADIERGIVLIGGEYHSDAEKILIERHGCQQKNVWGGGFDIRTKRFETNAVINIRPETNESMEIIEPDIRSRFLELARSKLKDFKQLL